MSKTIQTHPATKPDKFRASRVRCNNCPTDDLAARFDRDDETQSGAVDAMSTPSRPTWSATQEPHLDDAAHPDDRGTWHRSADTGASTTQDQSAVVVYANGFRHENGDDWPDTVSIDVADGRDVQDFSSADARALAVALLAAADLLDGEDVR
ncbi:hypothetical protein [Flexivirga alba]|uniref:Uncharacterized protein n=1 Tax=Flexivirga alba TaxID=702742 RepID=A0ABW2AKS7_9MICO